MSRAQHERAVQESRESVWFLKDIMFEGQPRKIITQNYNGPCSFIAICNILIIRGDITILPPDRKSVSYEHLAQLVGEYLLHASPDVDISAALSMMPLTQKGMDLNPLFTSTTAFRPAGDNGALKLFEQAKIELVHGWIVDPDSPEYKVLSETEDYDTSVNLIVAADDLAKGQLVLSENSAVPGPRHEGTSSAAGGPVHISDAWSEEERKKVEDAIVVRNFLDSSSSQMTYHGLFTLASTIKPGALVALFRNSHLSVLHKPRPLYSKSKSPNAENDSEATALEPDLTDEHSALYTLVTDHVFYNEPSVVWERIEDVDGSSSTFVDAEFVRSNPAGGDFAGHTPESALAAMEREQRDAAMYNQYDPADRDLARRLQAEEDAHAREMYRRGKEQQAQRSRERSERHRIQDGVQQLYNTSPEPHRQQPSSSNKPSRKPSQPPKPPKPPKIKKKTSCIIM